MAVVAILVTGVAVWPLLAAVWRNQVTVTWGTAGGADLTQAASCREGIVRTRRFAGVAVPVLPARPGMDCRLPVTVTNNAPVPVRVEAIVLDAMGPEAGAEIQVRGLEGLPIAPQHSEAGHHAAFTLGLELAPGEAYRVSVPFTHRAAGCSAATTWIEHFPSVVISALGVAGEVSSKGTLAFRGTGTAAGCSG